MSLFKYFITEIFEEKQKLLPTSQITKLPDDVQDITLFE